MFAIYLVNVVIVTKVASEYAIYQPLNLRICNLWKLLLYMHHVGFRVNKWINNK